MLGQLDFKKSKKYVKKFVSNLIAYETGEPGKQEDVALIPTEIQDAQIQNIFFIGAGLYLAEEELMLKGQKKTRYTRQQAVKDMLSDLYSGAAPRLLADRPKVVDVKDACLVQEASFQAEKSVLKGLLKEENSVSSCVCRGDAFRCKTVLMKILGVAPKDLESQLEKRIETEIEGLHFYMVYRDLWAAFDKSPGLHNSKKEFKDALDACEKAFVTMEKMFQVEKAAPPETEEHLDKNRLDKDLSHQTSETSHVGKNPTKTPTPETMLPREEQYRREIDVLQQKLSKEKSRREALSKLKEKNFELQKAARKLSDDKKRLNDALRETKAKLSIKKEWAEQFQCQANKDKDVLQDAVKRLQKQIDEMEKRHQVQCNELKADSTKKASDIQRHQQRYCSRLEHVVVKKKISCRLYEEAQKRLAENAQEDHLSDLNRPSEVAKRYDNLSKKACDVARVLVEYGIDEDNSNRFIVEMLIVRLKELSTKLVYLCFLVDVKQRS